MRQKMSTALITVMGVALLIYTASRTLSFLRMTLPASSQDTAYLALVAFDGGLLLWTLYYLHGARGPWQRGISALMVMVDLAGVVIGFAADTMWTAAGHGLAQMAQSDAQTAILAMVAIIALNVAAVVVCHLTSPDALLAQAEEEARDKITIATLQQIGQNAVQLASELAPKLAADWQARTRQQHLDPVDQKPPAPPIHVPPARLNAEVSDPEPEIVPAAARKNGHRPNS